MLPSPTVNLAEGCRRYIMATGCFKIDEYIFCLFSNFHLSHFLYYIFILQFLSYFQTFSFYFLKFSFPIFFFFLPNFCYKIIYVTLNFFENKYFSNFYSRTRCKIQNLTWQDLRGSKNNRELKKLYVYKV